MTKCEICGRLLHNHQWISRQFAQKHGLIVPKEMPADKKLWFCDAVTNQEHCFYVWVGLFLVTNIEDPCDEEYLKDISS